MLLLLLVLGHGLGRLLLLLVPGHGLGRLLLLLVLQTAPASRHACLERYVRCEVNSQCEATSRVNHVHVLALLGLQCNLLRRVAARFQEAVQSTRLLAQWLCISWIGTVSGQEPWTSNRMACCKLDTPRQHHNTSAPACANHVPACGGFATVCC